KEPPQTTITPADQAYLGLSFWRRPSNSAGELNSPSKVTAPLRRFGMNAGGYSATAGDQKPWGDPTYAVSDTLLCACKDVYGANSAQAGADLLLADLSDFELNVLW